MTFQKRMQERMIVRSADCGCGGAGCTDCEIVTSVSTNGLVNKPGGTLANFKVQPGDSRAEPAEEETQK